MRKKNNVIWLIIGIAAVGLVAYFWVPIKNWFTTTFGGSASSSSSTDSGTDSATSAASDVISDLS